MTPDDFAALAAFAGPLYQESRVVESFISNNPMPGTHKDNGSMSIKQGLEQAQNLALNSVVRPQPMYVPPAIPLDQPDPIMGTASYTPYVQPQHNPQLPTPDPGDQLEFSFNTSEQTITNDLLRDISKKLTKVISLLEKSTKEDTIVPKLKQNAKNN
jgi:hypothetical protein